MTSAGIRLFESLGPGLLPTAAMAFIYENNAKKNVLKTFIANFMFGEQYVGNACCSYKSFE